MSDGLRLDDVTVYRGELPIVRGVTLAVPPGEVTVLLGANGAGKTTLLDAIAGVIPAKSGAIELDGRNIGGMRRDKRSRDGLAYVEQGRTIFGELTVDENLAVAARGNPIQRAYDLFPELVQRRAIAAQMLSGGEQQMLVLARALLSQPSVLMIDEMSQGLAPVIVRRLLPFVEQAAASGIAVLLVEQFAALALSIGTSAAVLSVGQIVLEGSCAQLRDRMDDVRRAYLSGASSTPETVTPAAEPGRGSS
ncbi:ABC transporter ATP-binding protein [Microbacterium sp.]|uniref:ABC transporter ATP-binding protein n=1 Tax=Microbacterium sp. TaxID=51671 RepID=UPI003A8487E1